MKVLYSFVGYQTKRLDLTNSEKKSLGKLDVPFSSYRRYLKVYHGKRMQNFKLYRRCRGGGAMPGPGAAAECRRGVRGRAAGGHACRRGASHYKRMNCTTSQKYLSDSHGYIFFKLHQYVLSARPK